MRRRRKRRRKRKRRKRRRRRRRRRRAKKRKIRECSYVYWYLRVALLYWYEGEASTTRFALASPS